MADPTHSLMDQGPRSSGVRDAPAAKKQRFPAEASEHGIQRHQANETQDQPQGAESQPQGAENNDGQEADQYHNMTETAKAGFYMLETRVSVTDAKIEELTQAGALLLDRLKEDFMHKMQEYKQQVHSYAQTEAQNWAEQSAATQQAIERLHTAKHLVSTLGLNVID